MTTADYLEQLEQDREDLVDNLEEKGITGLTGDETFTQLVPEVLNISTGVSPDYTGHLDEEGLTTLGWLNSDIQYFKNNYIQWQSENDDFYKLTNDDKTGNLGSQSRWLSKNYTFYNNGMQLKDYTKLIGIPLLNTSNITNMYRAFHQCYNLMGVPILDTSNVTNFQEMFKMCNGLYKLPTLNTSNGTNFLGMFGNDYGLKKVGDFDLRKATDVSEMFGNCRGLISIGELDASGDTLTTISGWFSTCMSLQILDLSKVYTSHVTNMSNCFNFCLGLKKLDIRNMTFTSVTNYTSMFGPNANEGPPNKCLIIVKDSTAKTWITSKFNRLTNVKTVAEYEASLNS